MLITEEFFNDIESEDLNQQEDVVQEDTRYDARFYIRPYYTSTKFYDGIFDSYARRLSNVFDAINLEHSVIIESATEYWTHYGDLTPWTFTFNFTKSSFVNCTYVQRFIVAVTKALGTRYFQYRINDANGNLMCECSAKLATGYMLSVFDMKNSTDRIELNDSNIFIALERFEFTCKTLCSNYNKNKFDENFKWMHAKNYMNLMKKYATNICPFDCASMSLHGDVVDPTITYMFDYDAFLRAIQNEHPYYIEHLFMFTVQFNGTNEVHSTTNIYDFEKQDWKFSVDRFGPSYYKLKTPQLIYPFMRQTNRISIHFANGGHSYNDLYTMCVAMTYDEENKIYDYVMFQFVIFKSKGTNLGNFLTNKKRGILKQMNRAIK